MQPLAVLAGVPVQRGYQYCLGVMRFRGGDELVLCGWTPRLMTSKRAAESACSRIVMPTTCASEPITPRITVRGTYFPVIGG